MKRNDPQITIENNTIFLIQDLKGLNLYERGKAIRRFINSDTKVVEDYCDTLCRAIFRKYGININSNDKQAYKEAFDTLNGKGIDIKRIDFYKNADLEHCEVLSVSSNSMTILLEDNRFIECGIEIVEVEL